MFIDRNWDLIFNALFKAKQSKTGKQNNKQEAEFLSIKV